MRVISADGHPIGFVQRITETEIITSFPHRNIPIASIREVTDAVYIALRDQDMQDGPSPAEKGETL